MYQSILSANIWLEQHTFRDIFEWLNYFTLTMMDVKDEDLYLFHLDLRAANMLSYYCFSYI